MSFGWIDVFDMVPFAAIIGLACGHFHAGCVVVVMVLVIFLSEDVDIFVDCSSSLHVVPFAFVDSRMDSALFLASYSE